MQIGKSVYVDLEIEDLSRKNFLDYKDVVDLQIVETAGTSLPVVYMSFITRDFSIANYIMPCLNIKTQKVKYRITMLLLLLLLLLSRFSRVRLSATP